MTATAPDLPALYASQRERIGSLVLGLAPGDLATPVVGCPGWDVLDVVAHLTGLAAHVADRLPGDPAGDEFTGAAVGSRRGRELTDILQEWDSRGSEVQAIFPELGVAAYRFLIDAVIHEDDLRETLGMPYSDGPASELVLPGLVLGIVGRRFVKRGLAPLALETIDAGFSTVVGDGAPAGTLRARRDDLARVLAGRRTRQEAAALDWSADPEPWLDALPLFGWRADPGGE